MAGIITGLWQKRLSTEERVKRKADAEAARLQDTIRQTMTADNNGENVPAKDAEAVIDFCGDPKNHEANVKSLEASDAFVKLGCEIDTQSTYVDQSRKQVSALTQERAAAAKAVTETARAERDSRATGAHDLASAMAAAEAQANDVIVAAKLNFHSSLLTQQEAKLTTLMDEQAAIECEIDPTSSLAPPLNFALHVGPREKPLTARAAAAELASERVRRRRKEVRAQLTKERASLESRIEQLDAKVEPAEQAYEAAVDKYGEDTDAARSAFAALGDLKRDRSIARERIARIDHEHRFA